MAYDFTKMRNILSDWNLELTAEKEQQFLTFYEMLVEKNKVMNLTAITEFEDVVEKHFLDSISLCRLLCWIWEPEPVFLESHLRLCFRSLRLLWRIP